MVVTPLSSPPFCPREGRETMKLDHTSLWLLHDDLGVSMYYVRLLASEHDTAADRAFRRANGAAGMEEVVSDHDGLMASIRDGDLYTAFANATEEYQRILLDVFGPREIVLNASDGGDARRLVAKSAERVGMSEAVPDEWPHKYDYGLGV